MYVFIGITSVCTTYFGPPALESSKELLKESEA